MPKRTLQYYLALPYQVHLFFDQDDKVWFAQFPELGGCLADGYTREEALAKGEEMKALWIGTMLEYGETPPLPVNDVIDYYLAGRGAKRTDILDLSY